jgi:hypothetical protein
MLKHLEFAEAIIPQMNNYTLLSLDVFTQFLKIHLNHSEGTPIWLRRGENKIGHCVVIAKDNDNNLIIFDPQMNKKYTENEMKDWFERQEFTSVDFLIKLSTGKRFRNRSIQNEMQSQIQREHSASREPKKLKTSSKTSSKMSLSDSKPKTKINKSNKKTSRTRKTRRTIIKPDDDEITNLTNKISELKINSYTSNDIANLTDKISKLKI